MRKITWNLSWWDPAKVQVGAKLVGMQAIICKMLLATLKPNTWTLNTAVNSVTWSPELGSIWRDIWKGITWISEIPSRIWRTFWTIISHKRNIILGLTVESLLMRSDNCCWCYACGHSGPKGKPSDIVRHIESRHLNLEYKCKICDYTTRTKLQLTRHLRKYHLNHSDPKRKKLELKDMLEFHLT